MSPGLWRRALREGEMDESDTQVIVASRGRMVLMCLGSIAFCAIGGWLISTHPSPKAVVAGWAALVFFGLAGVMWAVQLVAPSRLMLDPRGVAFRYFFVTFRRRWTDIERIDVVQIKATRIVKLIGRPGVAPNLALGGAWPISSDELVARLEDRLSRFGRLERAARAP